MFLQRVSAQIRCGLVAARSTAMLGRLAEALELLAVQERLPPHDAAARQMLRAEIMHLEYRTEESLRIFNNDIAPLIPALPPESALIIEDNRVEAAFGHGLPGGAELDRHYGLQDRRRIAGVETRDTSVLLDAVQAVQRKRHFESLPIYSSAAIDAYRMGRWGGSRRACADLASELLRLGMLEQAIFQATLAENSEIVEAIAVDLRSRNDLSSVERVLEKLKASIGLRRHLVTASTFIARLGDAVPKGDVESWINRFRAIRTINPQTWADHQQFAAGWKATAAIIAGANADSADQVIKEALVAFATIEIPVVAELLIDTIGSAVEVASEDICVEVIEVVGAELRQPTKRNVFERAAMVMCELADRFPAVRPRLVDAVYTGNSRLQPLLVTIAREVGAEIKPEMPLKNARGVIERLRLQVERIAVDAEPRTGIGEVMIKTKTDGDKKIIAKINSSAQELFALDSYKEHLASDVLDELVGVIEQLIEDAENVNTNRQMLFCVLGRLCGKLSDEASRRVAAVAKRFAANHRECGHPLFGQEEQHSPLNPFQVSTGWPQDVRGEALRTCALVGKTHAEMVQNELSALILAAAVDPMPAIRRHAYRAAGVAGRYAPAELEWLIVGALDSDPVSARVALLTVAECADYIAESPVAGVCCRTLLTQSRNHSAGIRFGTSVAAAALRRSERLAEALRLQLDGVLVPLRSDVCAGVREATARGSVMEM